MKMLKAHISVEIPVLKKGVLYTLYVSMYVYHGSCMLCMAEAANYKQRVYETLGLVMVRYQ